MKTSTKFKIAGFAVFGTGAILTLIGLIAFFVEMIRFETSKLFWTVMVGLPLCAVGGGLIGVGFKPEIFGAKKLRSGTMDYDGRDAGRDAGKTADAPPPAFAKFFADADGGAAEKVYCKHCGRQIDADSRFCERCSRTVK